jgi:3-hydroxyisobutyrate dehydrogenase-like beta-hydroxyacid dehydrogenase
MGSAMALRLAGAGRETVVWNRTPAAAHAVAAAATAPVRVAVSLADAVRNCDVVLSVLADGPATCAVLLDDSLLSALAPGAVVCDLATSGVAAARELETGLAQVGVRFVDTPVSGSVPVIEAGGVLVMAGGDAAAIASATPVLQAFARTVVRVGPTGAGQAMKLAVNLVVHDLNAAVAEALVLAETAGISRESAYDVLCDSVVAAPFVVYKRQAFLDPDPEVAMSLGLVGKDLRLIVELAAANGVDVPVTEATREVVDAACATGLADRDMAALSRLSRVPPESGAATGAHPG